MVREGIRTIWSFVQDCVFPQSCLGCGVSDVFFCVSCRAQATDISAPPGIWVPSNQSTVSTVVSLTNYQPQAISGSLIEALKYTYSPDALTLVTQWIHAGAAVIKTIPPVDMVIPIPLHPRRLAERGFNQADAIAREVASILHVPLMRTTVLRSKHTKQQATLSKQERIKNVANAFTVINPQKVVGKTCLVVDDVYTTGSTMGQLAETLMESGVREVNGFTLARARFTT